MPDQFWMLTENPMTRKFERVLWQKGGYGPGTHKVCFSDKSCYNTAQYKLKTRAYSETIV